MTQTYISYLMESDFFTDVFEVVRIPHFRDWLKITARQAGIHGIYLE